MKNGRTVFIMALVMIAGAGVFLMNLKNVQRLGIPGVKVVSEPTYAEDGKMVSSNSAYLPPTVLDYSSKALPVSAVVLGWLPEDTTYGQRIYRATDGFEVAVNVVLMGRDRTSIHKPQYCLSGMGWEITESTERRVPIARPHPYELSVMKLTSRRAVRFPDGVDRMMSGLFVYWFVADNQLTAQHNERMRWMARDMLKSGVLQRWAYVSCFTICPPGLEEKAFERMSSLISASVPEFQLAAGPEQRLASLP